MSYSYSGTKRERGRDPWREGERAQEREKGEGEMAL